jgi:hypothetical protein
MLPHARGLTGSLIGPLKVSYGGHYNRIGQEFLEVAAKYDPVYPAVEDTSPLVAVNGYGVCDM